ncbi:AAA family ATPase [Caenimonas aquaedulcis]|uniref:ATP-binding protein n=1 Tax=Caenimonas aquaedulcis TaxID=2793270 RepID=A0A931H2Z7_9BURK|nr:ATP-binding protein [Caenimonas aquaedulcis]MBG9387584.1 ATP-binding protein [Caenimonas aquaedulcis]
MRIALLGAESTGKTQLSGELALALRAQDRTVEVVGEVLREWCAREGRTPRPEEQLPIAQEQERRVDEAAARAQVVISDTTAVMVAIYSAMLFEDGTLYRFALERLRGYDATLLTGLDIAWVADGLQRDGPHVREPVDALIRDALNAARVPYRVIYGSGPQRVENALAAIDALSAAGGHRGQPSRPWVWNCEKCGDPECEHRLFTGLTGR